MEINFKLLILLIVISIIAFIAFIAFFDTADKKNSEMEEEIVLPESIAQNTVEICKINGNLFKVTDSFIWYYNDAGIYKTDFTGKIIYNLKTGKGITAAIVKNNQLYYCINNRISKINIEDKNSKLKTFTVLSAKSYFKDIQIYNNHIYVSDRGKYKIHCIKMNGKIRWSSQEDKRFILPGKEFKIDITDNGELWLANHGRKVLEQLNTENGRYIAQWRPNKRKLLPGCCNPGAFRILDNNKILFLIKGKGDIIIFNPGGSIDKFIIKNIPVKHLQLFVDITETGKIYINYNNAVYRLTNYGK